MRKFVLLSAAALAMVFAAPGGIDSAEAAKAKKPTASQGCAWSKSAPDATYFNACFAHQRKAKK